MSAPEAHTRALAAIAERREGILAKLDRAHRMACSDPSDLARKTHYSEARDIIAADTDALAAVLERHTPSTCYETCTMEHDCEACYQPGEFGEHPWPCPDAAAALHALGVAE